MSSDKDIAGGVTAPDEFRAAGVACGIKADGLDLAVVDAGTAVPAAAVFTTNLVTAAPVLLSRAHLEQSGARARAVVINSGCANACTGDAGMAVARAMADAGAEHLDCTPAEILVASTGVIGVELDSAKVGRGIAAASSAVSREGHLDAARAILTTDLGPKESAARAETSAGDFRVGGMAKGAGMIEPNMAKINCTTSVRMTLGRPPKVA